VNYHREHILGYSNLASEGSSYQFSDPKLFKFDRCVHPEQRCFFKYYWSRTQSVTE